MMDEVKCSEFRILEFYPNTIEVVRKSVNLNKPGRVKEAVDLLEKWVLQQNHFVKKDFPRIYLETTLINAKGSTERAKQRLDKLCTLKTLIPGYYPNNITRDTFAPLMNIIYGVFMPKLTKEHKRVVLVKVVSEAQHLINNSLLNLFLKFFVMKFEYIMRNDYNTGFIIILDYRDLNILSYIAKYSLIDLQNLGTLLHEGYGFRVSSIHILTNSKLVDPLISLAKQFLSRKLVGRIQVNNNLESLYKNVEKDVLPRDYGGKEKSFNELRDQQAEILCSETNLKLLQEMYMAKTDEKKRQKNDSSDSYIGMPGSFRSLNID